MSTKFALFLLFTSPLYAKSADIPCKNRPTPNGGLVCVCDPTYCDTITTPEQLPTPNYHKYTSSRSGKRFLHQIGTFTQTSTLNHRIAIEPETKFQTIFGFGGAFTDATALNIQSLPPNLQTHLIRSYFSNEGIEYNVGRVPIGGTDFSTHAYSYDDGAADPQLENFALAQEDYSLKLPLLKTALEYSNNSLQLFASAWTAPKWMKTNNNYSGLGFLIANMYQTWANYFIKFLDAYEANGVTFWGITSGNEPSLGDIPFGKINSVGWWPKKQSQWIKDHLGPAIRASNHSDIKLMVLDDQRFFLPWFVNTLLKDNETRQFVDGIAVHWYYDKYFPASLLTKTQENFPEMFILATEACNGANSALNVDLGSWDRGESYANDIIEDLSNFIVGWVDWNMALNETGGPTYIANHVDSPIIVNATGEEIYKQPMFYALGHFSKFVARNSTRIQINGFQDKLVPMIGFVREDGATVSVFLNKKEQDVEIELNDKNRGNIQFVLEKKSITTLIYW